MVGVLGISDRKERTRITNIASGVQIGDSVDRSRVEMRPASDAQTALVAWINSQIDRFREYMYPFHRQWFVNIASIIGANSTVANAVSRVANVNPKKIPVRINHKTNLIGPNCRNLVGYLARSNPDMKFLAGDLQDPWQLDIAQGARRFMELHDRLDDWMMKRLDILEWSIYTGWGISKAVWDPQGGPRKAAIDEEGRPFIDPETGEPLVDRHGRPIFYNTGMSSTAVVSPFSYFYNTNARMDSEVQMRGEQGWRSFADQERMFPGSVKEFGLTNESQFQDQAGYYERQIVQTVGPAGTYTGLVAENELNGFNCVSGYIAPYTLDPEFFDGIEDPMTGERYEGWEVYEKGLFFELGQTQLLTCKANHLLDLEGTMSKKDWHPYTEFPCYKIPGRHVPQGIPDNLQPLEDALNFHLSRIREAARMMGQPKWFIPKGAGITKGQLTNEAGEKVYYNPTIGEPKAWSPVAMPSYLFNLLSLFVDHADRVGSSPPMSRGESAGQLRSGYAVAQMQEAALSQYTPMVERLSLAFARHKRQILLRQIQNSTEPITVQFEVENGDWEQEQFFANNMAPDFQVYVVPGTSMPKSEAANMALIDRLVAWGGLQPMANPKDREHISKVFDLGLPASFSGNERENIRHARYENWKIAEGQAVVTDGIFNHRTHVNEHIAFMLSQRYREMVKRDPEMRGRFHEHLGKHYGFLQIEAMGIAIPQPIPPMQDIQAALGDQAQPVLGALGEASGQGGGGGSGPPNAGPVSTGPGTQLGAARAGGAGLGQVPSVASVGAPENMG